MLCMMVSQIGPHKYIPLSRVIETEPCSRGVRQEDCLSPILFCLAEEQLGSKKYY